MPGSTDLILWHCSRAGSSTRICQDGKQQVWKAVLPWVAVGRNNEQVANKTLLLNCPDPQEPMAPSDLLQLSAFALLVRLTFD